MAFMQKKQNFQEDDSFNQEISKEAVFMGASLEVLRDLKERIDKLYIKVSELERKFEERIPEKTLSESRFKQEIVSTDDVVEKITSEIRALARPLVASRQQLTIVEQKRIERIVSILQEHGRLSSTQLAGIMGLSRTRCNEYFKQMEEFGLVEGTEIGKEKYYRLKD